MRRKVQFFNQPFNNRKIIRNQKPQPTIVVAGPTKAKKLARSFNLGETAQAASTPAAEATTAQTIEKKEIEDARPSKSSGSIRKKSSQGSSKKVGRGRKKAVHNSSGKSSSKLSE